ncbi:hypothetical protein [Listeria costaricensis]|uniref:hypothetical protein n=1 Tax=Listeria costaricensis TaxID=2026604 RepID=UPI000C077108|nr:hypothetical protein [Listeria costaricensis]
MKKVLLICFIASLCFFIPVHTLAAETPASETVPANIQLPTMGDTNPLIPMALGTFCVAVSMHMLKGRKTRSR